MDAPSYRYRTLSVHPLSRRSTTVGLEPMQARFATAAIVCLIPLLPLFMGGRTPFVIAYLSDALLVSVMAMLLLALFWSAPRAQARSPETRIWVGFALAFSAYVLLQVAPLPPLSRLLGPYPDVLWQQSDVKPLTWSPNPFATLLGWTVFLALWTAAYAVCHLPSSYLGWILLAVAVSTLFQAVYGPMAHATGSEWILGLWGRVNVDQVSGTFTNRNLFAGYLALTGPLAIGMWWSDRIPLVGRLPVLLRVAGALLSGALVGLALLASASRLGAAAGVFGMLVAGVLWLQRQKGLNRAVRWSLYATAAAALAAALWYGLAPLVLRYVERGLESDRWEVWRLMLGELPWHYWMFGVGLGGFEAVFKTVQSAALRVWYDHAHNDLLQWLLEMGIMGAVLFGIALLALWRRRRNDTLRAALYGGLVAIALVGLGDFSWHLSGTQLVIACYLGILLRPSGRQIHKVKPEKQ
jgi:Lipid A core - O-antigen ligase and related enzymes